MWWSWASFAIGAALGAIALFLFVFVSDLLEDQRIRRLARKEYGSGGVLIGVPKSYERCRNYETCGWWFRTLEGCDECNHCLAGKDQSAFKRFEDDPLSGPDWRPS